MKEFINKKKGVLISRTSRGVLKPKPTLRV
jgi:hypothetical protein